MKTRLRGVRALFAGAAIAVMILQSGCAMVPYSFGRIGDRRGGLPLRPGELQFERGRSNVVVDVAGNILGIPSKILLWNLKVDNHHISSATEAELAEYLAANSLSDVKVRLNQYAPGREWSRLFRNKSVGAGWRYTIGMLSCLVYTILPGRLFGGDSYNPYTDSISLYSDLPPIAIHEGGHAKDFARREYKGTYAFFYGLPIMALYPERIATGDAIGYIRTCKSSEEEKAAYKILYPAYATYIGGEFGQFTPWAVWIYIGAVIPGHVAGRIKAAHVEDRPAPPPQKPDVLPPPATEAGIADTNAASSTAQEPDPAARTNGPPSP